MISREPTGERTEVVFIGGRSGVGKSTAANTMHARLAEAGVTHAVIEGDTLDLAWPPPWEYGLAERNLTAIWANYRALGYRRLIYTNTVSVLEAVALATAMGDAPHVIGVLLTADDATIEQRLAPRESGAEFESHLERSRDRATELEARVPASVHRVSTDGRSVDDVATELIARTGWLGT